MGSRIIEHYLACWLNVQSEFPGVTRCTNKQRRYRVNWFGKFHNFVYSTITVLNRDRVHEPWRNGRRYLQTIKCIHTQSEFLNESNSDFDSTFGRDIPYLQVDDILTIGIYLPQSSLSAFLFGFFELSLCNCLLLNHSINYNISELGLKLI